VRVVICTKAIQQGGERVRGVNNTYIHTYSERERERERERARARERERERERESVCVSE
jgi:hypothetical protein